MLRLTKAAEEALLCDIQTLLKKLADCWDPDSGVETTVLNTDLEEATRLSDILEQFEVD